MSVMCGKLQIVILQHMQAFLHLTYIVHVPSEERQGEGRVQECKRERGREGIRGGRETERKGERE